MGIPFRPISPSLHLDISTDAFASCLSPISRISTPGIAHESIDQKVDKLVLQFLKEKEVQNIGMELALKVKKAAASDNCFVVVSGNKLCIVYPKDLLVEILTPIFERFPNIKS